VEVDDAEEDVDDRRLWCCRDWLAGDNNKPYDPRLLDAFPVAAALVNELLRKSTFLFEEEKLFIIMAGMFVCMFVCLFKAALTLE
jgi:hypothetical protein